MKRRLILALLALAAAANTAQFVIRGVHEGIHVDFASYLAVTYYGVHHGWPNIYDWQAMAGADHLFGAPVWPNQYLPVALWLFVPLLSLPYPMAYGLWVGLMGLAMLAIWRLLVPPESRLFFLLLMLAFRPVTFSLLLGQVIPLVALGVVASAVLLERRRDALAGSILVLVVLKPNIAFLVPLVLLAAGRWRALVAFAVAGAIVAAVNFAALGTYGVSQYLQHSAAVAAGRVTPIATAAGATLVGLLGRGPALIAADLAVVGAVVWVAYSSRRGNLGAAYAAAVAGSLLLTPYIHWQDFAMLLPAGWLWLRSRPDPRVAAASLAYVWLDACLPIAAALVGLAWVGVLAAEAGWRRFREQPIASLPAPSEMPA